MKPVGACNKYMYPNQFELLRDVLFVDVPYLYMVISRREKRDEFDQT